MTDSKRVKLEGHERAGMDEGTCIDETGSDAGREVKCRDAPSELMQLLTTTVEPYVKSGNMHQEIDESLLNLYITLPFFPCVSTCITLIYT